MINCSDSFISTDRNRKKVRKGNFVVNSHTQPAAADKMLAAIMKIPRRSEESGAGFDAMGISMVRCANDGSPVSIDPLANGKVPDIVKYDAFIRRLSHLYGTKYGTI